MSRYISRLRPRLPLNSITSTRIASIGIRHSSSAGPVYVPPSGLLFNERPPRQGKKRRREDWEPYMWTYLALCLYGAIIASRKKGAGIEGWAVIQARLRMQEDGINLEYKVD